MKSLRSTYDLLEAKFISNEEQSTFQKIEQQYDIAISGHISHNIKRTDSENLKKQFIPSKNELIQSPEELIDPIGDEDHSPVKGITHRYPDRVLLKPTHKCAVYCRFCFRREKVGDNSARLSDDELEQAFQYIEAHPKIWEVILTGGDPLFMSPDRINKIMRRLEEIPHIEIIRFHSRIPVVSPEFVNENLLTALKSAKAVYIVLHSNHPDEFSSEAVEACQKLPNAGIPLLSQSVLLKGINNSAETLEELFRTFLRNKIKPYYLHHPDMAPGTSHFRLSIEEGQAIMKELQGKLSGTALPTYVLDIPGGYGKVPLTPDFIKETNEGYIVTDINGQTHKYKSPKFTDSGLSENNSF